MIYKQAVYKRVYKPIHIWGLKYEFFSFSVPNFLLPRFPTALGVHYNAVRLMTDNQLTTVLTQSLPTTFPQLGTYARKMWMSPTRMFSGKVFKKRCKYLISSSWYITRAPDMAPQNGENLSDHQ
jgi:hypothetical protein